MLAETVELIRARHAWGWAKRAGARFAIAIVVALAASIAPGATQAPAVIDTSTIGPKVGERIPPFSGTDQFGRSQTLESSGGSNGTMLVFFRSADW